MSQSPFLTRIFKPADFTAAERDTILAAFQPVSLSRHAYLLRAGETERHYWFLEKGVARAFVLNPEGKDISTAFFTEGDIVIDWPSFFLRQPTRENLQALTDCLAWQIGFEQFQALFHGIEAFREQGRTNLVTSYFSLKQQTVSMVADQAKDRYLRLLTEKPGVVRQVSLKHLASYLGITDTSLSRIRKELANEKDFLP